MKTFLWTAAAVFVGIWLWSKYGRTTRKPTKVNNLQPVDTGTFFGPMIDPMTGDYLAPGVTPGAASYRTDGTIGAA